MLFVDDLRLAGEMTLSATGTTISTCFISICLLVLTRLGDSMSDSSEISMAADFLSFSFILFVGFLGGDVVLDG